MGERFCRDADPFCSGGISGTGADQRAHTGDPVTWLATRVVTSPRFAYAMVLPLFQGLTGASILRAPTDPAAEGFAEKNLAFVIQNAWLTDLAERFDPVHNRNHPLIGMDNVTCTPHLGYVEERGYEAIYATAIDQIVAFADGKPINVAAAEKK